MISTTNRIMTPLTGRLMVLVGLLMAMGGAAIREGSYNREYGVYVGRLKAFSTGISGQVYIVDNKHLFLRNFRYLKTKSSPPAYFWIGDDTQPSPKGQIVPYPTLLSDIPMGPPAGIKMSQGFYNNYNTQMERKFNQINGRKQELYYSHNNNSARNGPPKLPPIPFIDNESILLRLPEKVSHIRWFSIWCERFTVSLASLFLPTPTDNVGIPSKMVLKPFPETLNRLSSGPVTILDSKSFYIPNLQLMILEPGYHFWVGNSRYGPDNKGQMVANEKATFEDLTTYNRQDIIISLPQGMTVFDINYLAIFNVDIQDDVGHIKFNVTDWRVPPALGQTKKPGWWFNTPIPTNTSTRGRTKVTGGGDIVSNATNIPYDAEKEVPNCKELLGRKIRLMWLSGRSMIYFRVKVHMDLMQYAAVGFVARGSPEIEADVVKMYYNVTLERYITQDQFIAKTRNCDFSNGLCPDVGFAEARDDIMYMGSVKSHGLSIIDFKKSITVQDLYDAPISMDGPTQVLVAIGSLSSTRSSYGNLNMEMENTTIDFSSKEIEDSCPDVNRPGIPEESEEEEMWETSVIQGVNLLVAHLGPPGGKKGYKAITGASPTDQNVVWWINNKLLPEIYVERGKTYFFRVQGGDDPHSPRSYHPLYITSHAEGGYGSKSRYEQKVEDIYAGIDNFGGRLTPTGVGPLCELTSEGADKASESDTMEDYYQSLHLACSPGRTNEYGWVNWTVANDTPDLLYYQSFMGYGLGWKIHVINEGETANAAGRVTASLCVLLIALLNTEL